MATNVVEDAKLAQAIRLALKEAGITTRPRRGHAPSYFMCCWDYNWYNVAVFGHEVEVGPLAYSKRKKRYIDILDGKRLWAKEFDLTEPDSLARIVRYIKHKRKARGRFV